MLIQFFFGKNHFQSIISTIKHIGCVGFPPISISAGHPDNILKPRLYFFFFHCFYFLHTHLLLHNPQGGGGCYFNFSKILSGNILNIFSLGQLTPIHNSPPSSFIALTWGHSSSTIPLISPITCEREDSNSWRMKVLNWWVSCIIK